MMVAGTSAEIKCSKVSFLWRFSGHMLHFGSVPPLRLLQLHQQGEEHTSYESTGRLFTFAPQNPPYSCTCVAWW